MPMPFTQLMQETWDEAVADMDEHQRQLADSWRIAIDAAHDGMDAMRDIYPRRHTQLTGGRPPAASRPGVSRIREGVARPHRPG